MLGDPCALVQILLGQPERRVVQAPTVLVVAISVREEQPCERRDAEALPVARLEERHAPLVPLRRRLGLDLPLRIRIPRDPLPALEHVPLVDEKARDVQRPVAPGAHRRAAIALALGQLLEAQQRRDGAPALLPRAQVDARVAAVVQREAPLLEVEAEPLGPAHQTVLVPHAADERGPRGHARRLDLGAVAAVVSRRWHLPRQRVVSHVAPVAVWHHVGDAGRGGGLHELRVRLARCQDRHGDYEELLAAQGGDEGGLVGVVDGDGLDAGGQLALAVGAGQGRDGVPACLQELLGDAFANGAAGLGAVSIAKDLWGCIGELSLRLRWLRARCGL